jgi:hypothetical protein
MVFSNVKELLKDIYSDVKKSSRFIVWLSFRVSDKETLIIREPLIPINVSTTPAKRAPPKHRPIPKKIKIKKKSSVSNSNQNIKQEKCDAKSNVRKPH